VVIPGPLVADVGTFDRPGDAWTGAVSRYVCPGGRTGELEALLTVPPMTVIVALVVGSATAVSPTVLLVAPPADIEFVGPPAVSAPEPTEIDMDTPPVPVAPAARLGTPVILPGFKLEIPPVPVTYRLVGIATPLTEDALPPPPTLNAAPELLAPGNASMSVRPLVVKMMTARFAMAGAMRSSNMHSTKFGRNAKRLFIL
jgi:hypothetical protein